LTPGSRIQDPGWVKKNPDPGPGTGKKSGSGIKKNPNHISESLETIFWVKILKFFDADPDPGSEIFLTLWDGKISDPGSATLTKYIR
jgi:hypothetical protein